jgi:16S rRNA processing protein RimM
VQLSGVGTRDQAEELRGYLLEAADGEVLRDDDESFFLHEIIGLRVVTSEGKELGEITEVLQSGAADVYVIKGKQGEILIPAIGEVVQKIDLPVGVMTITPLPGLLDESK